MFTLNRPSQAAIEREVADAARLNLTAPPLLTLTGCLDGAVRLPFGFAHDYRRSCIGHDEAGFDWAKLAFARWAMFDLGWVRVANPEAVIAPGQIVAVEAHTLGLWSLNLSRIIDAVDTETRFGFLYATTEAHVEDGEERFVLEFDPESGDLWYELEAVSRPGKALAWVGYPFTRSFQHRFARDSHRRMKEEVVAQDPLLS